MGNTRAPASPFRPPTRGRCGARRATATAGSLPPACSPLLDIARLSHAPSRPEESSAVPAVSQLCSETRAWESCPLAMHATFEDDKERVRNAADIVRVIGDHIALKPKGREYACICPFHDDTSPSMYVSPQKQIFKCFACGAGGDVFSFVTRYHGMSFPEAISHLADQFGVTLSRTPKRENDDPNAVTVAGVRDACGAARDFYCAILRHPTHGALAREAIERRGISAEMAELFQLGAAPDRWDGLVSTIESKRLALNAFEAAGLVRERSNSPGHFDFLRNRLVFPILDQIGRPIAFGGRKLRDEDDPKYLNTPESPAFNKSETLYGYEQARNTIQRTGIILVVEGYTDVIACHQHGFTNAVAPLGTAFTESHIKRAKDLAQRGVQVFDNDSAGQKAADRAAAIFLRTGIEAMVATPPANSPAKDPDELFKHEGGIEMFRTMIDSAQSIIDFRYGRLMRDLDPTKPAARASALEEEVRSLAALGLRDLQNPNQIALYDAVVRKLSSATGLPTSALRDLIRSATRPAGRSFSTPSDNEAPATALSASSLNPHEHLLGCILVEPSLLAGLPGEHRPLIAPEAYASRHMGTVAHSVCELAEAGTHPSLSATLTHLEDEDAKAAAVQLADHVERITEAKPDRLSRHFADTLRLLTEQSPSAAVAPGANGGEGLSDIERLQRSIEAKRSRGANLRNRPRTDA